MAKVISQDTFNDVVKENIIEFEMEPKEAKEETIKQFEAQGINLANIIKDLDINTETGKPFLNEALESLKLYLDQNLSDLEDLQKLLQIIETECQKSIPHRVLSAKNDAHMQIITILQQQLNNTDNDSNSERVIVASLNTLNSMYNKQPDIFNATGLSLAKSLLRVYAGNEEIVCLTLQWMQKCCIMHELNRQSIMASGIVEILKDFIYSKINLKILREVLALCRFLVLDDDVRVEFGSAHEHARQIASEVIVQLTTFLVLIVDENILADLILTIGTLTVREEFCTMVDEADGIKRVLQVMESNIESVRLNREALKLLRALAGHDTVKCHIVQAGVAPILKDLLQTHVANENVVSAALACISTLTLRVKDNSKIFFETGISETIVEAMSLHANKKTIQRNGAWAIRNMVSRSRDQCDTWLSYGIEDVLNTALTTHPSIAQDIKAALRDLGCKVDLKEEWTGIAEKKITNTN